MTKRVESLLVDAIEVPKGHRALDEKAVVGLMESIKRIGLRTPISVRVVDNYVTEDGEVIDGQPIVVTGRHRLEAMRRLNSERIECWILADETEAQARMWEIAENLHRAELTSLERSEHLAEWVRLTEQQQEADKAKKPKAVSAQSAPKKKGRPQEGVRAAARELRVSRDDARRAIKIAENLTPEAKETAVEVGLDDHQAALLKAASAPAEQQPEVLREIAEQKRSPKEAPVVSEERELVPDDPDDSPLRPLIVAAEGALERGIVEGNFDLLVYAWEAADEIAKERFLQWLPARYRNAMAA